MPLLSSLDRYDRLVISDCLEPIDYADGDIILRQGDIGNSFFLIVSGRVRVVQKAGDREGEVGMLGPGQYFGEIALLTDSTRQVSESIRCYQEILSSISFFPFQGDLYCRRACKVCLHAERGL